MLNEFKKFIMRGNLVDLAIGFTVGASFSAVAKSLVNDVIMPPIGLLLGNTDFSNFFVVLKPGDVSKMPFDTISEAQSAGAVTINYGVFINNILALFVVALAMFFVIKAINKLDKELEEIKGKKNDEIKTPDNKKCKYCLSVIPYKASRCPACTSEVPVKKIKKI